MAFNAYIVAAKRTAGGRKRGALSQWHPADLGAEVINAILSETKMDGKLVDDVIFGCVSQIGAQSGNVGRSCVLASKLPESVPGTTVDRQCGSSQQAIHFAAQAVMSGTQDIVIAGGVESMTTVPIGSNVTDGLANNRGTPMSPYISKKYPGVPMWSQFMGAELVAKEFDISRDDMERLAVESHQKAVVATREGRFAREIVPLEGYNKKTKQPIPEHKTDEGIRPNSSLEAMRRLSPLSEGGRITAAVASQICDGAAAVLIVNERGLQKLGLKPRARIVSLALAATDPITMLKGPIPATKAVLAKAGLSMADMDIYEVNEAFASVPLAWEKALGADRKKLNVNGGAIALGHPLGGTGAKLMTTMVHEMERSQLRYGLQAICEGGGTANATIIERVSEPVPLRQLRARM